MYGYNVKITGSGTEDILLSNLALTGDSDQTERNVTSICFNKKTTMSANNRNDIKQSEFSIKGMLTVTNKEVLKAVADWAIDTDEATKFRKVEIQVDIDDRGSGDVSKTLRNYEFANMFVLDYKEIFHNPEDNENTPNIEQGYSILLGQKSDRSVQNVNY